MNPFTRITCLGGPADGATLELSAAPQGFYECVQPGSDTRHRYYLTEVRVGAWRWKFIKSYRPATQECEGR